MPRYRQVLLEEAVYAADGVGPVMDMAVIVGGTSEFWQGIFQLAVRAVTGTLPTLDVFVQMEMPNETWNDIVAFQQVSGAGSRVAVIIPSGAFTEGLATDAAMTLGGVKEIPLGPRYRVKWKIAGTAGPSFTFAVLADLYGSAPPGRE